ncbi:hypothetical protein F941_02205 [Acinetobacter bouvetii DSM 14964 = CIP 107468]|uniref:Uncharacterized protein n=1 Tax=Acinetobacter bouvetii DSM 14964 = CIP 107468 TaxID=1120925 RepID=N9DNX6_9GAMM|nr:hypothetical protein [Acinetobacter bouvetii]ENV82405.1 hypothetical protein F941_02205 [Acinetobacter bouvetii DSM 14964 = CIP 107468]BCU64192.1 hypothetical protein ACBO_09830 [Acinetobacter bouvetii]
MSYFSIVKLPLKFYQSFKKRFDEAKNFNDNTSIFEENKKPSPKKIIDESKKKILENEISELKSVYKLSIETRNFEITNLIHRNNFFMLFQGVVLAAVFSNQASKPYVEFFICLMGVFISWHQIKVAAGAKYWQEWWEVRTSDIENKLKAKMEQLTGDSDSFISLFDFENVSERQKYEIKVKKQTYKKSQNIKEAELFDKVSKALISGRYSVSRVPIASGIILLLTWLILFVGTIGVAESVLKTTSKYEVCLFDDICKTDNTLMLHDLWKDFKFVNGHYFADTNSEQATQIIFNQYNQK